MEVIQKCKTHSASITGNRIVDDIQHSNSNRITEKKLKLNEIIYSFEEGSYAAKGVKIKKLLSDKGRTKYYLGIVEEIETDVFIKVYNYNIEEDPQDSNLIKTLYFEYDSYSLMEHPNLISYYDLDIINNPNAIVIIMEYLPNALSLSSTFQQYNKQYKKNRGFPFSKIKIIMKGILEGLSFLHSKGIIHKELNLDNILVTDDLSTVKIINYEMKTNPNNTKKFPYYSSPEVCFEQKKISVDVDIWSVGCILFELFCGYRPYYKLSSYETTCKLSESTTPIEAASDDIKDIFYDRKNRSVLDFLNQCFRGPEIVKPRAEELLKHKLFK